MKKLYYKNKFMNIYSYKEEKIVTIECTNVNVTGSKSDNYTTFVIKFNGTSKIPSSSNIIRISSRNFYNFYYNYYPDRVDFTVNIHNVESIEEVVNGGFYIE